MIVDWTRAACRDFGRDGDQFFPERGVSSRAAKQVCAPCPIREGCLQYALVNDERHGVWGGLSERQRRPLRRQLVQAQRRQAAMMDQVAWIGYAERRRRAS